jgi:uncharacterized membrane protein YjjP (DUF1212 family)
MHTTKDKLTLAVEVGTLMLTSGAEVYRVTETIKHICHGLGLDDFDVYVLTNGIFASAHETQEDACSVVRNITKIDFHLGKVSALNQLSRDIYNGVLDYDGAMKEFALIKKIKQTEKFKLILFCGLGSGAFTYLFGGTFTDAFVSVIDGLILGLFLYNIKGNKFIRNIFGAFIVSLIAMVASTLFKGLSYNSIVIGDLMPLVPGIALTTGVRDLFYGDYLSGAIKMLEALLSGLSIAVGVGTLMTLIHFLKEIHLWSFPF